MADGGRLRGRHARRGGHDPSGAGGDRTSGPGRVLERLLAAAASPDRFGFEYERAGTQVLGCVVPNLRFSVSVDRPTRTVAARDADGRVVAVRRGQDAFLDRRLFTDPPFRTRWLAVPAEWPPPPAVGSDLVGYLFGPSLPADGAAIVDGAAGLAGRVTERAAASGDPAGDRRFVVALDHRRYDRTFEPPPSDPTHTTVPVPRFDLAVDPGGNVDRISVSAYGHDGRRAPADQGWTVRFDGGRRPVPVRALASSTSFRDLAGRRLRAGAGCTLRP